MNSTEQLFLAGQLVKQAVNFRGVQLFSDTARAQAALAKVTTTTTVKPVITSKFV